MRIKSEFEIDDDNLELSLSYRLREGQHVLRAPGSSPIVPPTDLHLSPPASSTEAHNRSHGITVDNQAAVCKLDTSSPLINCGSCLESRLEDFLKTLAEENEKKFAMEIIGACAQAGASGSTYDDVLVSALLS